MFYYVGLLDHFLFESDPQAFAYDGCQTYNESLVRTSTGSLDHQGVVMRTTFVMHLGLPLHRREAVCL